MFRDEVVNPRRACVERGLPQLSGLCVCVCLSVKSHLTSRASVRREKAQRETKVKKLWGFL